MLHAPPAPLSCTSEARGSRRRRRRGAFFTSGRTIPKAAQRNDEQIVQVAQVFKAFSLLVFPFDISRNRCTNNRVTRLYISGTLPLAHGRHCRAHLLSPRVFQASPARHHGHGQGDVALMFDFEATVVDAIAVELSLPQLRSSLDAAADASAVVLRRLLQNNQQRNKQSTKARDCRGQRGVRRVSSVVPHLLAPFDALRALSAGGAVETLSWGTRAAGSARHTCNDSEGTRNAHRE